MTPTQRHQRVRDIFHEVCDRPAPERAAIIRTLCGEDETLFRDVLSLLDHDARAGGITASGVAVGGAAGAKGGENAVFPPPGIPAVIGQYKLLRLIGTGGMGSVFEAEQRSPYRQVALKVLRGGVSIATALERFRREARLLGKLQHPAIGQIFEAGTFDGGFGPQPFFAMELVRGLPLDEYARGRGLPVPDRVALMTLVCDGVAHAHTQGVIHRDLKPGNILVDGDGRPKILDFGIARAVGDDASRTVGATQEGQIIGTLEYMSPEQASGSPSDIDIRCDVYSLGVILFELLTGKLPHNIRDKPLFDAIRTLREQEPRRLRDVDAGLRGDLDTIVAKALERAPQRRYASAAALGEDLRRCQRDEPVLARPASALYTIRKFSRRHRALVAGTITVFVVLVAGVSATTWQAIVATQARDLAKQRLVEIAAALDAEAKSRSQAEQVLSFLTKMLDAADPLESPNPQLTVREVLEDAATRVDAEFADQPELATVLHHTVSTSYRGLGLYPETEHHLRRSIEVLRRGTGGQPGELGALLSELGSLLFELGRPAESVAALREAVQELDRAVEAETRAGNEAGRMRVAARAAEARGYLAMSLEDAGEGQEVETLYRRALSECDGLVGEDQGKCLRPAVGNLARFLFYHDRPAEAEPLMRRAVELQKQRYGDDHPLVGQAMSYLAALYQSQGRHDEAEPLLRAGLEMARKRFGNDHVEISNPLNNLAFLLETKGDMAGAEQCYRDALALNRKYKGDRHPEVAINLVNLAALFENQNRPDEVIAMYREAESICAEIHGEKHWITANGRSRLGAFLTTLGKFDEAEPLLRGSVEVLSKELGEEHERTKAARERLKTWEKAKGTRD